MPPLPKRQSAPTDTANHLLSYSPATMQTVACTTSEGRMVMLTIRTPTITLTVFVPPGDATKWVQSLEGAIRQAVSGLILPNGSGLS